MLSSLFVLILFLFCCFPLLIIAGCLVLGMLFLASKWVSFLAAREPGSTTAGSFIAFVWLMSALAELLLAPFFWTWRPESLGGVGIVFFVFGQLTLLSRLLTTERTAPVWTGAVLVLQCSLMGLWFCVEPRWSKDVFPMELEQFLIGSKALVWLVLLALSLLTSKPWVPPPALREEAAAPDQPTPPPLMSHLSLLVSLALFSLACGAGQVYRDGGRSLARFLPVPIVR